MTHPLLDQLIDYAGLFPPASLPLPAAVAEYAAHRDDDEAWMMGRFICPVNRLGELIPFHGLFPANRPLRLCVLPESHATLLAAVKNAVLRADGFAEGFPGSARVEVFEARVPVDAPHKPRLAAAAQEAGGRPLYVEWPPGLPDLPSHLDHLMAARGEASNLGAKIRCGGVSVPSVEEVAAFIHGCVRRGIPFKATAGLHHPVRHDRDGVVMHGFLNVFGAAILTARHALDEFDVRRIVAETRPEAFSLRDGGFAWSGLEASHADVLRHRAHLARSYGSCSFREPVDDLQQNDWFGVRAL